MKNSPNYPLTPDILEEIKDMSGRLLPIPRMCKVKNGGEAYVYPKVSFFGHQLLKHHPELHTANGQKIKPGARYIIDSPEPEMLTSEYHSEQLKKAYINKGYGGILEYVTRVKEIWTKYQEEIAKKGDNKEESSNEKK